jgi:hypothetical protein
MDPTSSHVQMPIGIRGRAEFLRFNARPLLDNSATVNIDMAATLRVWPWPVCFVRSSQGPARTGIAAARVSATRNAALVGRLFAYVLPSLLWRSVDVPGAGLDGSRPARI